MKNNNKPVKVISFCPSTDAELNRWVLLHYGIDFIEKRHAPPFYFLIRKFYRNNNLVFCRDGNKTLNSVRETIEHFDALAEEDKKLIPGELKNDFNPVWQRYNHTLGRAVETWLYAHLLPKKEIMARPLSLGSPWLEKLFVNHYYTVARDSILKANALTHNAADEALKEIRATYSDVDGLLADGRKYLYGDRLSVADLAFVVSSAPLILPAGYGGDQYEQGAIPTFEQFPKALQEIISAMRKTPAGRFVLRVYAEDRYTR